MIEFVLNDQRVVTDAGPGMATLDFIRKRQHLTGTKLVCKEGECGACTVLVGSLEGEEGMTYQSMTSCIMPLINAHGKHIVTVEGLTLEDLSPVQQAMVDSYGTQCGFCTPGFVVSLTGYLLSRQDLSSEGITSAIDGNICRCTGYKSIERAAGIILDSLRTNGAPLGVRQLIERKYLPAYFAGIATRLREIETQKVSSDGGRTLGGGTDLYVQRPEEMYESEVTPIYDVPEMKAIKIEGGSCTFGASLTMGDLHRSKLFREVMPDSAPIFKLLSSTQIRNMATIGGNLVNASPIGDFTILLLALNASIELNGANGARKIPLHRFYHGYKQIDLTADEVLTQISFPLPKVTTHFHFEKVSQRKYFDIASVNFASRIDEHEGVLRDVRLAVGGVGPVPLYLQRTSGLLSGKELTDSLLTEALAVMQSEIRPISDARGSADYKRLLARQLFLASVMEIRPNIVDLRKLIRL